MKQYALSQIQGPHLPNVEKRAAALNLSWRNQESSVIHPGFLIDGETSASQWVGLGWPILESSVLMGDFQAFFAEFNKKEYKTSQVSRQSRLTVDSGAMGLAECRREKVGNRTSERWRSPQ